MFRITTAVMVMTVAVSICGCDQEQEQNGTIIGAQPPGTTMADIPKLPRLKGDILAGLAERMRTEDAREQLLALGYESGTRYTADESVSVFPTFHAYLPDLMPYSKGNSQQTLLFEFGYYLDDRPLTCKAYVVDHTLAGLLFSNYWAEDQLGIAPTELFVEYDALLASNEAYSRKFDNEPSREPIQALILDGVEIMRFSGEDWDPESESLFPMDAYFLGLTPELQAESALHVPEDYILKQHGDKDKPLDFGGLVEMIEGEGATGVLGNYDCTKFEYNDYMAEFYLTYSPGFEFSATYISDGEDADKNFMLGAYDDGQRMWMSFTDAWFTAANDCSTEELYAQFSTMWEQFSGDRGTADSDNDELDMEFSFFIKDGLHFTRKHYFTPPAGVPQDYYKITVIEMTPFSEFMVTCGEQWSPVQEVDLPTPNSALGPVERLIRLAATGTVDEIGQAMGLEHNKRKNAGSRNWTAGYTSHWTAWRAPDDEPLASVSAVDESIFTQMLTIDEWIAKWASISRAEVFTEMEMLAEQFDAEREMNNHPSFSSESVRLSYGPMAVFYSFSYVEEGEDPHVSFFVSPPQRCTYKTGAEILGWETWEGDRPAY